MGMKKLKVGDKVVVLSGRDRGRRGVILKILSNDRALVEGINLVKKHVRPDPQKNQQGGIIERESGIHCSNLALVNPVTDKAGRVGFKVLDDCRKVRYFKSNDEVVDV